MDVSSANVLVVGSGGRESAIAWSLSKSHNVHHIFVSPGNGGTAVMDPSRIKNVKFDDIVAFSRENGVKLVIVGPEVELANGLADVLSAAGIACFGPSAAAARIESSKAWAKSFMQRHGIPTADYNIFTDYEAAATYINNSATRLPLVVKASGLAAGKGVVIAKSRADALAAASSMLVEKQFGGAGAEVVIETFLVGSECSVLAFSDGTNSVLMPAAQDHKCAFEFNCGPNTGGMGVIVPARGVTTQVMDDIKARVIDPAIKGLRQEGHPFVGVLFAGIMLTASGPQVLEFNCRFGDPETQALLPLLQTDLYNVCSACVNGTLAPSSVSFADSASAVVIVASRGYPGSYQKNVPISSVPADGEDVTVFHAGTDMVAGKLVTTGGRVFAVSATAPSLTAALQSAYEAADRIKFDGAWYRRDIGGRYYRPQWRSKKLRVAILGSTNGTDVPPIVAATRTRTLAGVEITLIASNKEDAGILEKGRALGVETVCLPSKGVSKVEYDAKLVQLFTDRCIDVVLLVGYMRILTRTFTDRFMWRAINVHPSLLPEFAGGMDTDVHAAVLAAKKTYSGCTVHFVTEEVDGGAILLQKACNIDPAETPTTLKAKVQALEAEALIEVLQWFCDDSPYSILPRISRGDSITSVLAHVVRPAAPAATALDGPLTYAQAGVDIDAGDSLVEAIKPLAKSTRRIGADAELGGFGGLFDIAACGYTDPVIVSSTDGVGTKLRVAISTGLHTTVGQDLVAMSVNDLIVQGAEPIFFLDYFATSKLEVPLARDVIAGIAEGCKKAGCALVGGETAEMPSMYHPGDYDLAGFAVGLVERSKVLPRLEDMHAHDVVIGLPSTGVHSNGYSLVRKVVEKCGADLQAPAPYESTCATLAEDLMKPTEIYIKCLLKTLQQQDWITGLAHITGGGLPGNVPRVLPPHLKAVFHAHSWPIPPVFRWLAKSGGDIDAYEMLRTFNCGLGMVLIVKQAHVDDVLSALQMNGSAAYVVGSLEARADGDEQVEVCEAPTLFA